MFTGDIFHLFKISTVPRGFGKTILLHEDIKVGRESESKRDREKERERESEREREREREKIERHIDIKTCTGSHSKWEYCG